MRDGFPNKHKHSYTENLGYGGNDQWSQFTETTGGCHDDVVLFFPNQQSTYT